jgi:hypothetical protein
MNSVSKKSKTELKKSLLDGAVNAAAGALLFGELGGSIDYFGMSIPVSVALFATGTTASMTVYKAHDYLMPGMAIDQMTGLGAVGPVLAVAAANVLTFKMAGSGIDNMDSALKLGALGGGSFVASSYLGRTLGLL